MSTTNLINVSNTLPIEIEFVNNELLDILCHEACTQKENRIRTKEEQTSLTSDNVDNIVLEDVK